MKRWVALTLITIAGACSSSSPDSSAGSGGHVGSGGASGSGSGGKGSGGSDGGSGGAVGSGGTPASSGGATGTGGNTASGGASSSGGTLGSGGTTQSGGKGGGAATGGATSSGGMTGGGGQSGKGGAGAAGRGGGGGGGGGTTAGAKKHAFLLLGQSNMAGYPKAEDSDKVKNSRIQVLGFDDCAATGRKKDQWDVAVPPLHECFAGAIGPGDWFSKTLIDQLPAGDTILLVPCAVSGMPISYFQKGMTPYDTIVRRAKAAQAMGGVIEAMLFHQGESDAGSPAGWPAGVKKLVTDLRTDLGLAEVPFLAGELAPTGADASMNKYVAMLPDMITNAFVISATGLTLDPGDTQYHVHFGHDSQVELGKRYEAKVLELLRP